MNNLSLVLVALTASASPMVPSAAPSATAIVQPIQTERNGAEAVAAIRAGYQSGVYSEKLNDLDSVYQTYLKEGQLEELAAMREGMTPELHAWEEEAHRLQKEKNAEMLEAIADQKTGPFVDKVVSAASPVDDLRQKAIARIAEFRAMKPGTGKNNDENRLIDLDLEYEFKALHMEMPGATSAGKKEQHIALKMEKLDKMLQASSEFEEGSLKNAVALYADGFDERMAHAWDAADLNALASGQSKPQNAVQEKIAGILKIYHDKLTDLTRKVLADNETK